MRLNHDAYTLIHPAIDDVELISKIMERRAETGLIQIDFTKDITLRKMSSKNKSPNGYPDAYRVIDGAVSQLLGDMDGNIWMYAFNVSQWFKTSPILRVEKLEPVDNYSLFSIETENSMYELSQRIL